ncbi:hypothetical protein CCP1ISM_510003 [Azospirillaceae bacterium]
MTDVGLAAFSVFFMQSPSFLAHQEALVDGLGRDRSNAHNTAGPAHTENCRATTLPLDIHDSIARI